MILYSDNEIVVCIKEKGVLLEEKKLRDKFNTKIVVAHVNHNIRPESYNESIEVEKYCKNNNLLLI